MTYRGHIKNGVAVLDEPILLPEGAQVKIQIDRLEPDFWEGKSAEQFALEQGVLPCKNPSDLAGDWPENESVDDFIGLIKRARI
jgi:hypothetical protein